MDTPTDTSDTLPLTDETAQAVADAAMESAEPSSQTPEEVAAAEDKASLSEHEDKFGRDARGRFTNERHRAESQKARAEDVPRIRELTKTLRQTQRELEDLKKQVTQPKSTATPASARPIEVPRAPSAFTMPEPKIEDFADQADPYASYVRALARYDRDKEKHEQAVADHQRATEEAGKQSDWTFEQIAQSHGQRLQAFKAAHADFDQIVGARADVQTSPAMQAAVMLADDGPEMIYALAKDDAFADELFLQTDGKPVTPEYVAIVQRRLRAKMQAAPTGSAAPRVVPPAPRLPNPVKTMPQPVRSDGRPGDDAPLSAHEKWHYPDGPKGRFRP